MKSKLIALVAAAALSSCATQTQQSPKELIADTAVVFAAAQDWWIATCIHPIAPAPKFCADIVTTAKVAAASDAATAALKTAADAVATNSANEATLIADAVADVTAYATLIATFKGKQP
jgi:hypothetical protein